jgi:hypothetical protein
MHFQECGGNWTVALIPYCTATACIATALGSTWRIKSPGRFSAHAQ